MKDSLKPYPAYKDSGVPWLGTIPAHWDVKRLKAAVAQINEQALEKRSNDVYVALEHVESWTGRVRLPDKDVAFDSQVKRFQRGDVLFGKLRPYLAKVARLSVNGVCVGEFLVLRPRSGSILAPFIENVLRSKPIIDVVNSSTFGAKMPRADWDFVGNLLIGFPPPAEQAAIVRYLDHADRRIRRYIAAKRRLIALLNEQKQAIIHRAVTRGLDPDVRLKPSGVEWLGDVPEHWDIVPLGRFSIKRCDGPFGSGLKSSHYTDSGVRVVRLQNIGFAEFRNQDAAYISAEYYASLGDHDVLQDDLLIAGLGDDRIPAGRACVAPIDIEPAMVKADCFRFRLDKRRIVPKFVAYHLSATAVTATAMLSTGATRQRINLQSTARREIAVPPVPEQKLIVDHITEATHDLLRAIERINREIDLIREYRTRLIADVVTGKLDVRAAAASLPDEIDEPEGYAEALAESDELIEDAEAEAVMMEADT